MEASKKKKKITYGIIELILSYNDKFVQNYLRQSLIILEFKFYWIQTIKWIFVNHSLNNLLTFLFILLKKICIPWKFKILLDLEWSNHIL